jgi:hypothetical protein
MWSRRSNSLLPSFLTSGGYRRPAAAVFLTLAVLALPVQASTVVFGSYLNADYAADKAQQMAGLLGIDTRLLAAEVNGQRYLRILGPDGLSTTQARDLLNRAHASGISGAWIVATSAPNPAASLTAEPLTAEPPLLSILLPISTAPSATAVPVVNEPLPQPAAFQSEQSEQPAVGQSLQLATSLEPGASIHVPKFDEDQIDFRLDGELNEAVWQQIPGYDEMRVLEPDTLEVPRHRTIVRYFYTSKALYVSMYAEQPPETIIERLSSRDDYFLRDGMSITLDTSGDGIYGYWFSVSLGGSLADGKIAPERQYSGQWDGPWDAATARNEHGWTAEMVLPWSMMAMPSNDGVREIGLYVSRLVGHVDERFGFPALPSTGARFMSALQPLEFEEVTPRRQLDFYPYVSGSYDAASKDSKAKVGADMFWRPSTNLQMSATLNPDFGAVETDDVVVNLTATETFFPEKRLFFLEGNEIFATTPRSVPRSLGGRTTGTRRTTQLFNSTPVQVVNTRRIGGGADTSIPPGVIVPGYELSKPIGLLGALKGTGQVGGIRYGAMAAFEDDIELQGTTEDGEEISVQAEGRDYGVVRLLYQSIGLGRKSIGYIGTHVIKPTYDATVHGIDGHYLSSSGKLQLDAQLLASDVDSVKGYGALLDMNYTQRRGLVHAVQLDAQDDTVDINDLGFLRRNDNYGGTYSLNYTRSHDLKTLRSFSVNWSNSYWQNGDGLTTRVGTFLRNSFTFRNLFEIRTELDYFPKRWDDLESNGNGAYRIDPRWVADIAFGTDASRIFSFSGRFGAKIEDLGGTTYRASLGVTAKPNDRFSLDLDLNYADRDGWLLHQQDRDFTTFSAQDFQPRLGVDWFLSSRQQFRMSLQWAAIKASDQAYWELPEDGDGHLIPVIRDPDEPRDDFVVNRMTVQLRYRWQIAPLSDLFVVYTRGSNVDSMIDDSFGQLFQDALGKPVIDFLVVKLRYRFGI